MIDGVGRISHPLQLRAQKKLLSSLHFDEQDTVKRTVRAKDKTSSVDGVYILLLEDDKGCEQKLEQWAMEYTSKFVHAAGPEFHSTTIAQILGTAYVKRNLPEVSGLSKKC